MSRVLLGISDQFLQVVCLNESGGQTVHDYIGLHHRIGETEVMIAIATPFSQNPTALLGTKIVEVASKAGGAIFFAHNKRQRGCYIADFSRYLFERKMRCS
jgi:hypothetical protein